MTARILVVDDLQPNLRYLEARLTAEYFDVKTATSGPRALEICRTGECDIVLLDAMMPEMDGFETCRLIKADVRTSHIPVVIVTALDERKDRVRGLEAGADDFLTKPIDEMALLARVRSLARLKVVIDELRSRASTAVAVGVSDGKSTLADIKVGRGRILLVDDRPVSAERFVQTLGDQNFTTVESDAQEALFKAAEEDFDLCIVSLGLKNYDGLRLCSQLRSLERTRSLPILIIAEVDDRARVLRGLDLGVNDYLMRPIDSHELLARVRTQLRRKRYVDQLRDKVQHSIELALVDPLTGLNNRRFLENHLATVLEAARARSKPVSLMILDIDHFKRVNDSYGHDCGDEVLKSFADRMRRIIRGGDLLCRLGGEEFVIVMPNVSLDTASRIAERARAAVEEELFVVDAAGNAIPVTVSIGLAQSRSEAGPDELYRRADQALYRSKSEGRNRVSADAA